MEVRNIAGELLINTPIRQDRVATMPRARVASGQNSHIAGNKMSVWVPESEHQSADCELNLTSDTVTQNIANDVLLYRFAVSASP